MIIAFDCISMISFLITYPYNGSQALSTANAQFLTVLSTIMTRMINDRDILLISYSLYSGLLLHHPAPILSLSLCSLTYDHFLKFIVRI